LLGAHGDFVGQLPRHELAIRIDLFGRERAAGVGMFGWPTLNIRVADHDRRGERAGIEQRELGTALLRRRVTARGRQLRAREDLVGGDLMIPLDCDLADLRAGSGVDVIEPRDRLALAIDKRAAVPARVTVPFLLQSLRHRAAHRAIRLEIDRVTRLERDHLVQRGFVIGRRADELDRADVIRDAFVDVPRHRDRPLVLRIHERRLVDLGIEATEPVQKRFDAAAIFSEPELVERAPRANRVLLAKAEVLEQRLVRDVQVVAGTRFANFGWAQPSRQTTTARARRPIPFTWCDHHARANCLQPRDCMATRVADRTPDWPPNCSRHRR
jgi:hypothetical protein